MDILLWHEILEPYELAVKELQVKFRHLIKEHHGKGLYSPIESVSGRVKSVSSILEKMQRKGIVPEEREEQMEDIAGIFMMIILSTISVSKSISGGALALQLGLLVLYLVLGMLFGCFGPLFNFLVLRTQDLFQRIHGGNIKKWVFIGGLIGGLCGLLGLMQPSAVGGGFNLIPIAAAGNFSVGLLLFIFIARVVTTLICFSSGAPGGIFAPMLALGTLLGTAFGMAAIPLFPAYHLDAGTFAIAGMGALLAASVRAPLTGIVLVLEMTDNYQLILPMIITCLGATLLAQFLGGKPLYSTILQRTLAKQEAEQAAKAQQAPRENT